MSATLERRFARRRMARRIDEILPLELSAKTPTLAVTPAPIGKPGGPGLWHVKGMQFPPYFQQVRNALIRNGHSTATASQITWGAIRRWARGGGNVHPEVRAAARSALASIAGKEARAHAQSAAHEHTTLRDQLTLREFARTLELADPYHGASGSGHGGQFVSASQQGSGAPAGKGKPPVKRPPGQGAPTVSPQQKKKLLAQAAADDARALALRQEAAKINRQISALTVLIAQEQKSLATAAKVTTGTGAGTTTAAGTGTTTAAGKGTTTAASQKASATASATAKATAASGGTRAQLAAHQQQVKQLTAMRNQLLQHASQLSAQAASLRQQANG